MRKSSARACLLTLALALAGNVAWQIAAPCVHAAPPAGNVAVIEYADEISRMVQDRKLEELAKLDVPATGETAQLGGWKNEYVSEMARSDALRTKSYSETVAKAQDLVSRSKFDEAIDKVVAAYLLAPEQAKFLELDWVKELTSKVATQAAAYEKDGQWLESLQLYSDLNSLYEIDTRYKPDMQRLARRVRLLAVYTPQTLFDMRKAHDAKLEKEKTDATQPATTQAATQDAAVDAATFTPWQDHVTGITLEMAEQAIDQARRKWVEPTNYETLLKGGVEALRLFLTTPELAKEFPSLKNDAAKAKFTAALDEALTQIKPDYLTNRDSIIGRSQMHLIIDQLLTANKESIGLPEKVVLMEFTDGAMEKLDPFTAVIWPHEAEEFEKNIAGTFGGVGIQISLENGKLNVISPLEDTPAFQAGIEAGDEITAIDGKTTVGISIDQAVHHIMGEPGSKVELTIKRAGKTAPLQFALTRATIHVSSVKGFKRDTADPTKWNFMIDPVNRIGYIRITGFQGDTAAELRNAIKTLSAQQMKGFVIDLRFNPGGLLKAAIEMSDMFLDHGTIVSTKGATVQPQGVSADPETLIPNSIPMVVLVNQYSASASEIFSGAMKDLHRGLIVGHRSFGKGSVQNVMDIGDAASKAQFKLTTQYYYLPDGESLHRRDGAKTWGVEPDISVDMTPAQITALIKARRDVEIIAAHNAAATNPDTAPATQPQNASAKSEPLIDTQLDTAMLMLRLQLVQQKL